MKALIADPEEYELVMTPLIAYLIILRRRTNQIKWNGKLTESLLYGY